MGCGASAASSASKRNTVSISTSSCSNALPPKPVKTDGYGHAQFIINRDGRLTDYYELEDTIGVGTYGSVVRCRSRCTGSVFAVKTIPKASKRKRAEAKREMEVMKNMDHPNIVKLYECFEDHRCFYLVMELLKGGELFNCIVESNHFSEREAALVMEQAFRAVYYMHGNCVIHRDLKPENFLFTSQESLDRARLKLIDFGFARFCGPSDMLSSKVGTPYYVAPQVLSQHYDRSADLWSCGVITYVLLCGYPPFGGDTDKKIMTKVRRGNYSFDARDWSGISEDGKNLIRMLLKMNPSERYTAEQALNHVWVKSHAPRAQGIPLKATLMDNLKCFSSQNKLKKAALHVIASQLDEEKIASLREVFMALDENGDGLLSAQELREGMENAGFQEMPPDLQRILQEIDSDGNGVIDYTEFLAASLDRHLYYKEDTCWAAFRVFDLNNDGKISKDEMANVLGNGAVQDYCNREVAELMRDIDTNGDGEIDFAEFMQMMRGGPLPEGSGSNISCQSV